MGAKIAHFAEPELKNTSTRVTRTMKPIHMGIPVKPMLSRKSAPAMADMAPRLVQENRPWNCPQKKQKPT